MPNVDITIGSPILLAGQYFIVEYRLQGTPTWTAIANQTNAQFTVSLAVGVYEFRFTLVQSASPLVTCTPVVKVFEIVDEGGGDDEYCVTGVSAQIVPASPGPGYNLSITYTAAVNPACGWSIQYTPAGSAPISVVYGSGLPASPILIPVNNVAHNVIFRVQLCTGLLHPCYEADIDPDTTPCVPAVLTNAEHVYLPGLIPAIKFTFSQSVPITNNFLITYLQTDIVTAGVPDAGGPISVSVTPSQTTIIIPINPNPNLANPIKNYAGTFVDGCNNSTPWTVSFD